VDPDKTGGGDIFILPPDRYNYLKRAGEHGGILELYTMGQYGKTVAVDGGLDCRGLNHGGPLFLSFILVPQKHL
jgi:hypothetical protein